jgi:fatty-acyl-CoA synthase
MDAASPTVTGLLLAQAGRERPGLLFEDRRWSWREHVGACARYAAALRARRVAGRPFHVGVLADNGPEFSFLLGGCAFAGAVFVALNPVRRGAALAADVARTDCQFVLAEPGYAALLPALDVPVMAFDELELPAWAPVDPVPAAAEDLLMLIFTSGTSGEPKAVRVTHAKIAVPGVMLAGRFGLGTEDTVYVSMPMFHSNAVMAGWAVGLAAGAAIALRRRFSASAFLDDIRAFGATYANYVGKPLSYVLATPERAGDADNPLRIAYGNEGAPPTWKNSPNDSAVTSSTGSGPLRAAWRSAAAPVPRRVPSASYPTAWRYSTRRPAGRARPRCSARTASCSTRPRPSASW